VLSTLTWSEGYHANKHHALIWQALKEMTPSNLVVHYGVTPLSIICHVKNHRKPNHHIIKESSIIMTNSLNRLQHILNRQQRYIATVHTVNNNGTTLVTHRQWQ
jgi:hypothetical protein